jgi:hypothetical protein
MSSWARARARAPRRGKGEAQSLAIAGAQRRGEGVEVVNLAENIVGSAVLTLLYDINFLKL